MTITLCERCFQDWDSEHEIRYWFSLKREL